MRERQHASDDNTGRLRREVAWMGLGALLGIGIALVLSLLHSSGMRIEELALRLRFDIAHRKPSAEVAMLEVGTAPTADQLAASVERMLGGRAVAVGILVPLSQVRMGVPPGPLSPEPLSNGSPAEPPAAQGATARPQPDAGPSSDGGTFAASPDGGTKSVPSPAPAAPVQHDPANGYDALAIALRHSDRVVLPVELYGDRVELPPGALAAGAPLAFRDVDIDQTGPLSRRLERQFLGKRVWSMAAQLVAVSRGISTAGGDDKSVAGPSLSMFGRLAAEGRPKAQILAPETRGKPDVQGKIVLISRNRYEAEATAKSLASLLRTAPPVRIGLFDLLLVVGFAIAGALMGARMAGRFVLAADSLLLALLAALLLDQASRERFPLALAPAVALICASAVLGVRRQSHHIVKRERVRRRLTAQTSRELAIDLAADPASLLPHAARLAVLVSRWPLGMDGASFPDHASAELAQHEEIVLSVAKRFGGIVSNFSGDEVVVVFGLGGFTDSLGARDRAALLASRAALEVRAMSQGRAVVGLDLGGAFCGVYGPEGRLRAHGEVVLTARLLAQEAERQGKGVLVSERAFADVSQRMEGRVLERAVAGIGQAAMILDGERPPTGHVPAA